MLYGWLKLFSLFCFSIILLAKKEKRLTNYCRMWKLYESAKI